MFDFLMELIEELPWWVTVIVVAVVIGVVWAVKACQ